MSRDITIELRLNLYPYSEKNAILFVEICRKDGIFYESFDSRWTPIILIAMSINIIYDYYEITQ